jgi:hypothetical protein
VKKRLKEEARARKAAEAQDGASGDSNGQADGKEDA